MWGNDYGYGYGPGLMMNGAYGIEHLVFSLFESILEEFAASDRPDFSGPGNRQDPTRVPATLKREVSFLEKRKNILAVMLMEALKAEDQEMALFRCAERITSGHGEKRTKLELFFEFFTGFIPLIAFVTLRDKWCEYFDSNADDALRYFVKSFVASHVETRL